MDKLIYTAMTGASHILQRQAAVSQNLANSSTPGYRATTNAFRAVPLVGEGLPTRTFVVDSVTGFDATPGGIQATGRALDVAITGRGWIAVQTPDGKEAYTRAGSLEVTPAGLLQTHDGRPVVGEAGPISIPPNTEVSIANDGTISTVPSGSSPAQVVSVGRLKLVAPPERQLVRGDDGLFRMRDGSTPGTDASVRVASGSIENSNVNVVESMVDMISLARQFEMQMKLLKTASDNEQQASQILNING